MGVDPVILLRTRRADKSFKDTQNKPFRMPSLATFWRKKPFLDDRATDLGARTRRQIAAGKV
jgi:hypothetical protein